MTLARIAAVFLVAVVLDAARILQWDRKPERKLHISLFAAWRYYCDDLPACFLVFWLRNKMSIAALHLSARRKLSFLFGNGKGRCFISIQSRPEMMPRCQLLIKCTAVVKLAGWRGFLEAAGVILPQIKLNLWLVWLRNGDTHIPWDLVLQLVLLFCLFIYSSQGGVTVCTSQHKCWGTAEWWSCQLELWQWGLKLGLCCCELLFVKSPSLAAAALTLSFSWSNINTVF